MPQKSIYDAINEVQRNINNQRMKNSESNWNAIQEADDESNSSYWNQEAERNRAKGGKPLPNEFNIFGNKQQAPAPSAAAPQARSSNVPAAKPKVDPNVMKQQQALIAQGHNIKADGIMGPKTQNALRIQGDKNKYGSAAGGMNEPQSSSSMDRSGDSELDAYKGQGRPPTGVAPGKQGPGEDYPVDTRPQDKQGAKPPAPAPAAPAPSAPDPEDKRTPFQKSFVGQLFGAPGAPKTKVEPTVPPPSVNPSNQASSAPAPDQVKSDAPAPTKQAPTPSLNDYESGGPPKDKKKMSESTLISATLALIGKENMFEAAKRMKGVCPKCGKGPCQCAGDPKKMEEESLDEKLVGNQKNLDKNHNNKLDSQDFKMLRGKKMEEEKKAKPDYLDMDKDGNKKESMKKAIKDKKIKDYRADRDKHGEMEEETDPGFSEAELAHFASVLEAVKESPMNALDPTVIDEEGEAAKRGRGRPPGKVGAYKRKDTAGADDDVQKGTPHVLDQIRHAHERGAIDSNKNYSITHPADDKKTAKVPMKAAHKFYTDYHGAEKPEHKEKMYKELLATHFGGDDRTHAPTHAAFNTDLSKVDDSTKKGAGPKPTLGGSKLVGGSK